MQNVIIIHTTVFILIFLLAILTLLVTLFLLPLLVLVVVFVIPRLLALLPSLHTLLPPDTAAAGCRATTLAAAAATASPQTLPCGLRSTLLLRVVVTHTRRRALAARLQAVQAGTHAAVVRHTVYSILK